ncbi:MAG: lysylphosphatidylglycerol synthase transmembrane domain-containing protein [Candidatus Neomarinimicrobiota bacterium]
MNNLTKFILSLFLSVLGLYYAFNKVNISELWFYLRTANIFYIALAILLIIFSVAIRAERWQLLLEPMKKISFLPLFSSTMIGYFGNAVMPFRFGELLRAYSIGSMKKIDVSGAFGTILLERLLDMLGLVFTMFIFSWFYPFEYGGKSAMIIISFSSVLLFSFVLWLGSKKSHFFLNLKKRSILKAPFLQRLLIIINKIVDGITSIRDTKHLGQIIFHSIFIWVIYFFVTYSVILATNISIDWIGVGIILISTSLALAIPAAPGGLGTYHAAAVYILTSYFFIDRVESQAFAVILHAVGFLPLLLIGFIFFTRSSLHFKDVSKEVIQE